jgi:hypothetical protein
MFVLVAIAGWVRCHDWVSRGSSLLAWSSDAASAIDKQTLVSARERALLRDLRCGNKLSVRPIGRMSVSQEVDRAIELKWLVLLWSWWRVVSRLLKNQYYTGFVSFEPTKCHIPSTVCHTTGSHNRLLLAATKLWKSAATASCWWWRRCEASGEHEQQPGEEQEGGQGAAGAVRQGGGQGPDGASVALGFCLAFLAEL